MVAEDQILKYLTMAEVHEELKTMKTIGLPISAINLVGYLRGMVSVACMGRLGRAELAGGALAVGFTNITGYSVLSGLAMGMEPVCSQAFGSRNLPLLSRTLRRSILLLLLASLPISLLWLNLLPLLLRLRQDPAVSAVAARYCLFALPDLFANSLLHPLRVYFRSTGRPRPMMWCMSLSALLHLPLATLLSSAFGVAGVAVAGFAANLTTLLFLLPYISSSTAVSYEDPLSKPMLLPAHTPAAAAEWCRLIRLSLTSCLAVCLEWWWYELMTLAAGYLSQPQVALSAAAVVIQTTALMYNLPATLSATVSTRVGNELGAGRPERARTAAVVAMGIALGGSFMGLALTTVGRETWGRVFTGDGEVVEVIKAVLPVIGLCELANCPQTTGCGVLRGTARPAVAAAINLYSFYAVGAPVALVLAFGMDMGLLGLCLGLLAAQVVCVVSVVGVVFRTDWEREALEARNLVGRAHISEEEKLDREFL